MTGLAGPAQLLGSAWQLPLVLVCGWLGLIVRRRRIPPWYFLVATGACSAVPLVAFLGAGLAGHGSGRPQGAGPGGAGVDIPLWSLLSVMTGLVTVIALVLLTGVIELGRLWLTRPAGPKSRSHAVFGRQGPEVALRFHWRGASTSGTARISTHEDTGPVPQHLLRPGIFDTTGDGSPGGLTGHG